MNRRWLRWWWLVLIIPAVIGLARLRFDVEVLNLLPDELPVVHGLKLYQRHFTSDDELVITLRAPDAETAESAARQLAECLREETNLVATAVWQAPWQENPDQMAELTAYLWLNQPPELFAQLTNRLAPDKLDSVLRETRDQLVTTLSPTDIARLGYDPFGLTRLPGADLGGDPASGGQQDGFASADGTFRVVFVHARGGLSNYRACAAWLESIKATLRRGESSANWPGKVTVRFTGGPAFIAEVASGMERDIKASASSTLILIAALFWWAHHSWRPLLWLLAMLGLVVAGTLASGALIFGKLNAVSLGFAAILLGLAVDYGLVLYQEWVAAPQLSARDVRRILGPSIWWSSVTTAPAFALLTFGGLPGLAQLGSLVAIGIVLAAVVMLYLYLPTVARGRPEQAKLRANRKSQIVNSIGARSPKIPLAVTGIIALVAVVTLWRAWPPVDHSTGPLSPKHSPAQEAANELEKEMNRQGKPILLIISGRDEAEVARRLDAASAHLSRAVTNQEARSFMLPTSLWPHPAWQRTNLAAATALTRQATTMKTAAAQAGFTPDALTLTENVFRTWELASQTSGALWPTNQSGQWILRRAVAWTGENWLAVGAINPATNDMSTATLAKLSPELPGVWLTAWPLLGDTLLRHVEHRLRWVVAAMLTVVIVCLWLAFRRWPEVLLSFATLGFSLLVLLTVMGIAGWSWNLMNLMVVPILLGAGVDYTIHMQLALRRHAGDIAAVRSVTGRAIFLCAATTVVGFGSNSLSSNAGLASLGLVCAVGIAAVYLSSVYLLPAWWQLIADRGLKVENRAPQKCPPSGTSVPSTLDPRPSTPSSFYRTEMWSLGLTLSKILPAKLCEELSRAMGLLYWCAQPRRREVVIQNLLPALNGNRKAAQRATRKLFQEFAVKLVDLWRYEGGAGADCWRTAWNGWETLAAAQARGKGVLLVTPHLGNWEFGAAFFVQRGHKLLVLTQPEPDEGLTKLRQASRARWGVETLVVGEDAFAFIEIIKRLQAGATVALLLDRPPPSTAVTVELFGRPFSASIAAAELARASGCALLPTYVVRQSGGYSASLLPEITYDRATLGNRAARINLTQEILRAFEPAIREYATQWYHFVPVWP
jgi:predicted exporter/lauroyl/myristoyl acyltransferase